MCFSFFAARPESCAHRAPTEYAGGPKCTPTLKGGFHLMIQMSAFPHVLDLDMFHKSVFSRTSCFHCFYDFHRCVFHRFSDFLDFLIFETSQVSGFSRNPDFIDIMCLSFSVLLICHFSRISFSWFAFFRFQYFPLFLISDLLDLRFSFF